MKEGRVEERERRGEKEKEKDEIELQWTTRVTRIIIHDDMFQCETKEIHADGAQKCVHIHHLHSTTSEEYHDILSAYILLLESSHQCSLVLTLLSSLCGPTLLCVQRNTRHETETAQGC